MEWCDENESQHNSDLAFFIRYAVASGSTSTARATATTWPPARSSSRASTPRPPSRAATTRSSPGRACTPNGVDHEFDHLRVTEDVTHSFYKGTGSLHPWEGVTDPIDPAEGKAQGKYTWAKRPATT
jgi:Ni,Fe-hydrogenase I large subunit